MTQHHPHDPESADGRIKKPRHKKHQNQSYGERLAADPTYVAPRTDSAPVKGYRSEQPRNDRGQRSTDRNRDERNDRSYNRDDRPAARTNRDDRPAFRRDERPQYNRDDRSSSNRGDRPSYNRDERPSYNRDDRSRFNRDDRPQGNRDERPSYNRDDRSRFNRDDRSQGSRDERPRFNRDERPSFNRDDRSSYNRDDRSRFNRDDRSQGNRDERPRFNRDDRSQGGRGERPAYKRDERPAYNRDDRSQGERTDRSRFNRDDRPQYNRDERPRFNRDERPQYTNDRPRFDRDDKSYRRDQRVENRDDRRSEQAEQPVDLGTVAEDNQFAALGLAPRLVQRLARDGITAPFPIQAATIPDALAGKDVLGRGQTGSGKTLGFGLPTLMRLSGGHTESRRPRGMILVPTRELAMQVHDALEPLAHVMNVSLKLIAGGLPYPKQIDALRRGVDLLIATPGRLIDLCEQGAADLGAVEVAVLDEADHMCDMGFMPAVTTLLDMTPPEGQRLLFSATLDNDVDKIVRTYLKDPVQHSTESGQASVSTMEHHLLVIEPAHKQSLTAELASRDGRTIVFVRTKLGADRIATQLRDRGVMAAALHGGLTQGMRNRTLDQFKDGSVPVLVATDVAARGIHVDDVGLVVQADPPAEHKDYLHRAGRTARAGGKGAVVTLLLPHQRRGMIRMAESAGVKAEPVRARPGDELVTELTGGTKPSGYPVKLPAPKPQRFNKGGGKRFGSTRPGRGHDSRGGNGPRRGGNSGRRTDGKSYQH
ncbi:superfamily II DNA/RNA helicase [Kribbella pratensis]|uniref:Superfamily II DNA/RNA helicase n=1 Tax=Kribbella pratensis TaxID=2512112 RepID=A0ABY2FI47_9ACTN|nr:DEAD/DEAH box helicase [Kribbella pratensis]TDW90775.1 superfamily II DNA/RNA helicase [Kribbella pratensis]